MRSATPPLAPLAQNTPDAECALTAQAALEIGLIAAQYLACRRVQISSPSAPTCCCLVASLSGESHRKDCALRSTVKRPRPCLRSPRLYKHSASPRLHCALQHSIA